MQNRTEFGTPRVSTLQTNMDVSSQQRRNKSSQMHKMCNKMYNIFIFVVSVQYISFPSFI